MSNLVFTDCIGRRLMNELFDLECSIARLHVPQLIKILNNIKEAYHYTVGLYYEFDERETEYSETYYIKLDTDNNVILCNRSNDYIIRLVWESDMCDIKELAIDFAVELENYIVLPQYQHFVDYLASTKYYHHMYGETLEQRNMREDQTLLAYIPESV
jgi:hypothetical protein